MITYIQGDVTKCFEQAIFHGCNAQGKMNSGVAKAIRKRFPNAYDVYMHEYKRNDLILGTVNIGKSFDLEEKLIFNGITQEFYGYDKKKYVSYDAIEKCLIFVNNFLMTHYPRYELAMPKIGAGLGGGDWNIISNIIERTMTNIDVKVYTL